jgi:DNA modification methylase
VTADLEPTIIGDATLYLGDCLEILPTLSKVDAVVTDPPYGIGKRKGTLSKKRQHKNDYTMFEDNREFIVATVIPAIEISLSMSERMIITPGPVHLRLYPQWDALGSFYQPAAMGMCAWGRTTSQPILYYGRDPRVGLTIKNTSYQLTEGPSDKRHPCSKPIKAWMVIVDRASFSGDIVIDPFMGSGTTGVACMNLGRKFVGIEIEPKYFDIACERIDQAQRQMRMFS